MGNIRYRIKQFIGEERKLTGNSPSKCKAWPTCDCKLSKVRKITERDGKYTFCDIAQGVGIALSRLNSFCSVICKFGILLPDYAVYLNR